MKEGNINSYNKTIIETIAELESLSEYSIPRVGEEAAPDSNPPLVHSQSAIIHYLSHTNSKEEDEIIPRSQLPHTPLTEEHLYNIPDITEGSSKLRNRGRIYEYIYIFLPSTFFAICGIITSYQLVQFDDRGTYEEGPNNEYLIESGVDVSECNGDKFNSSEDIESMKELVNKWSGILGFICVMMLFTRVLGTALKITWDLEERTNYTRYQLFQHKRIMIFLQIGLYAMDIYIYSLPLPAFALNFTPCLNLRLPQIYIIIHLYGGLVMSCLLGLLLLLPILTLLCSCGVYPPRIPHLKHFSIKKNYHSILIFLNISLLFLILLIGSLFFFFSSFAMLLIGSVESCLVGMGMLALFISIIIYALVPYIRLRETTRGHPQVHQVTVADKRRSTVHVAYPLNTVHEKNEDSQSGGVVNTDAPLN